MITRDQVTLSYELVLGRVPENDQVIEDHMAIDTVRDLVSTMIASEEYLRVSVPQREEESRSRPSDREIEVGTVLLLDRLPTDQDVEDGRAALTHRSWLLRLMEDRSQIAPLEAVITASAVHAQHRSQRPQRERHRGDEYLAPRDLSRSEHEPTHVVMIGGCVFDKWGEVLSARHSQLALDRVLINNTAILPRVDPQYLTKIDFQLVQVPLRSILPEGDYMRLSYDDIAGYRTLFDVCIGRLSLFLDEASAWSRDVITFVMNYQRPQSSMIGRFAPRYDLRNPVYFIEELNRALDGFVSARDNCHYLDLDHIAGTFGRRHIQDDGVWLFNHGGTISDFDFDLDRDRMEPVPPVSAHYKHDVLPFVEMVWSEATAMWRTLKGIDAVKMVCVDLDDTLWRGVAAERLEFDGSTVEGWPLGVVEALSYLKKRGIILTIVSKNDPDKVAHLWGMQIGSRFSLDDFAIRKVGWSPKAETIGEAIAEANILPQSVIFLDDNPIERASVEAAIPGIRTIGPSHYYWRRILLWSSETQVSIITEESAKRNEMIGAQAAREVARKTFSREEFLASLGLSVELRAIDSVDDAQFARAFELLNKTNQFNTTGRRWTHAEAAEYFADGGLWITTSARDSYVGYGLIAVLIVRAGLIDQYVMSCRVVGLEVEIAALSALDKFAGTMPETGWSGITVDTQANRLSRDIFQRIGWVNANGVWTGTSLPDQPSHIERTD